MGQVPGGGLVSKTLSVKSAAPPSAVEILGHGFYHEFLETLTPHFPLSHDITSWPSQLMHVGLPTTLSRAFATQFSV